MKERNALNAVMIIASLIHAVVSILGRFVAYIQAYKIFPKFTKCVNILRYFGELMLHSRRAVAVGNTLRYVRIVFILAILFLSVGVVQATDVTLQVSKLHLCSLTACGTLADINDDDGANEFTQDGGGEKLQLFMDALDAGYGTTTSVVVNIDVGEVEPCSTNCMEVEVQCSSKYTSTSYNPSVGLIQFDVSATCDQLTDVANMGVYFNNPSSGGSKKWYKLDYVSVDITYTTGSAPTTVESTGPGGYGWQQVYKGYTERLTGSADREYYDYGRKKIQIFGRGEDYWEEDCGWWYTSSTITPTVTIKDGAGQTIVNGASMSSPIKGVSSYTYDWSTGDDPGEWNVTVTTTNLQSDFALYVRGRLNVTSISTTGSQANSPIAVNATVKDNAGVTVTGSTTNEPTVTMYVSGPGYYYEADMNWNGANWGEYFTSPNPGDHYIAVKAGDGHQYWVDGRGNASVSISGDFPSSFSGSGSSVLKFLAMFALVIFILRRRVARPMGKAISVLICWWG
ncbi:MAG: hypothetical protein V3T58_06675 [Candidatus Hydrothermarchaeales archaeon]